MLESQQLEDSSRQEEDNKNYESAEQRSPDPYKSVEDNKKEENKETIEDKLSYDVGKCFSVGIL